MNTKPLQNTLAALAIAALCAPALAGSPQGQDDQRSRLGIGPIEVIPSLKAQLASENKTLMVGRIVEAMEPQLIDRLHNSKKFRIVARGDLKSLIDEQNLAPLLNPDTTPEEFKISGVDYVVVVSIDHFEDRTEQFPQTHANRVITKRVIEVGAVAKLWNAETGELLVSANWELGSHDEDLDLPPELRHSIDDARVQGDSESLNRLLRRMGEITAQRVSNRVVDVVYPAQVVGVGGKQVFINRGDGTDIKPDEVWTVYALGQEMIDPATKVSLGRVEVEINRVRIRRVEPDFAVGEIIEEQDYGIEVGQILRRTVVKDKAARN